MMNYTRFADATLAAAIARRDAFTRRTRAEDAARRPTLWHRWFGRKHAAEAPTPVGHAA